MRRATCWKSGAGFTESGAFSALRHRFSSSGRRLVETPEASRSQGAPAAGSLQAHQAPASRNLDRLCAARHSQLLEEMGQMRLDGALADIQIVGDLLVGLPVRKKAERRHFSGG